MNLDELRPLVDAALDGQLTAEQAARLEQLVLTDPDARRFYVEHAHQDAALRRSAAHPGILASCAGPGPQLAVAEARPSKQLRFVRWRDVAWATVAASLLVLVWQLVPREPQPVARLIEAKACQWNAGTLPTEVGASLRPGRLRLAQGLARLKFDSGAEVTLEGPADLELRSPMACILHAGQLMARVPPEAIGFVVDTPSSRVTDFGTEFGLTVRDENTADVQVFNGRVDVLHHSTGRTEAMRSGSTLRFTPTEIRPFNPDASAPREETAAAPPMAAGAQVIQVTTAQGRGRDAFVMPLADVPLNRQSDTLLLIKHTTPKMAQWDRKAYLGMDLSTLDGRRIVDAELTLTFAPTGMGFAAHVPDATFAVYGLTDEALDDWDERALNWHTAPANQPGGAVLDANKVVRLGSFVLAQGEQSATRTISGEALTEFLRRDTNQLATLIVVRETQGNGAADLVHGVASKRHPTLPPPTLRLTVADTRR